MSFKSKKLFVDGRTDVQTDIFPPLILLGRLLEVDLINGVVCNACNIFEIIALESFLVAEVPLHGHSMSSGMAL